MCAQRRLRSAWASAQSDQSLLCAQWVAKDPRFLHADSEDCSDWADAQADLSFCWAHVILLVLPCGSSYVMSIQHRVTEYSQHTGMFNFFKYGKSSLKYPHLFLCWARCFSVFLPLLLAFDSPKQHSWNMNSVASGQGSDYKKSDKISRHDYLEDQATD